MAAASIPAEFAAALAAIGGFERRPLIAVAVSGGPDSMALALLADRWARQRGGRAQALTVDHRLRRESGDEAALVRQWLSTRGIAHETLVWDAAKPANGIQAAARAARYRLLAGWCRTHGCLHLLTGHHRDDQIETFRLRRCAGSGAFGLAAMSAVRPLDGCRLLRPLLTLPKAGLVAWLADENQAFVTDPSNRDPAFARARLRLAPQTAETTDQAWRELRGFGVRRHADEQRCAALLAACAAVHPAGFAAVAPAPLAAAAADLAERALERIAATIGGGDRPARRGRIAALRRRLIALPARGTTLGGCRWVPWRGCLLVIREPAAAAPPAALTAGAAMTWDRRFAVSPPASAAAAFTIGYLGAAGRVELRRRGWRPPAAVPPPLVYPSLPAFWDESGLAAVPHLGYARDPGAPLPRLVFRPLQALAQVGFTVV